MAGKDIIMLSQREWRKLHVIKKVMEGVLKQIEAAEILSLSDRQIRRLINRTKVEGDAGIAHKLRSKPSGRKLPKSIKEEVIKRYREKYNKKGEMEKCGRNGVASLLLAFPIVLMTTRG